MSLTDEPNTHNIGKDSKKEYFDELEYSSLKEGQFKKFGSFFNSNEMLLTVIGIGLFVVILVFVVFIPKARNKIDNKQLELFDAKLKEMEDRLVNIEWPDKKLEQFEDKSKKIDMMEERMDKLEAVLSMKLDLIKKNIEETREKSQQSKELQKSTTHRNTIVSPQKATKQYHQVRAGDTLYSIGRRYGISINELCRINKLSKRKNIYPGQKLLLNRAN
jgi:LysM repeat protein